ncbi:exopolysaccharide biosynthesis protein [Jannaschia faecimaris]|uniref:exopolysaccharide biosynthesis protein n=1 Tax=Jannaschia faecimaris TaxID=1244108 RepID=UPI0031387A00
MATGRGAYVDDVDPLRAPPLDKVLETLIKRSESGQDVRLRDMLDLTGSRVHGILILLLALPEAVPLPLPSIGAVLGVPLILISGHLALYGERMTLPAKLLNRRVPGRALAVMGKYGRPVLRWMERLSRSRIPFVANRERMIGLLAAVISFLLFLPIPFVNVPLAMILSVLAWGMVQRDGLFVLIGVAATVALALLAMLVGMAALEALDRVLEW